MQVKGNEDPPARRRDARGCAAEAGFRQGWTVAVRAGGREVNSRQTRAGVGAG